MTALLLAFASVLAASLFAFVASRRPPPPGVAASIEQLSHALGVTERDTVGEFLRRLRAQPSAREEVDILDLSDEFETHEDVARREKDGAS